MSATATDELTALGLGSCIGLAIVDRNVGVAGLAHVVLPESHPDGDPGKFADTAVPALVERMSRAGAVVRRMEAVIVGGARMFEMSGALDIGARNDQAVRAALAKARVALRASETGGHQGRTLRIGVGGGVVSVRTAGQPAVTLLDATHPPRGGAAASRSAGTHQARAVQAALAVRAVRAERAERAVRAERAERAVRAGTSTQGANR